MPSHMRTHAHAKKADGDIWKDGPVDTGRMKG